MASPLAKTAIGLQYEYMQYQQVIQDLERDLTRQVKALSLDDNDLEDALDFVGDHVTLFRFLRNMDFKVAEVRQRLLETVHWRRDLKIPHMTWHSVANEFFGDGFAFFHKQDRFGRPVAVIRMRHFPKFKDPSQSLSYYMTPFAHLVMEIARHLTRQATQQRQASPDGHEWTLISQIAVVIDIVQAPFVTPDTQLMRDLRDLAEKRFPGMIGSVYIMNFGWAYQGIWQVVKLMLSEQAKSRIAFPTASEMADIILPEDLLADLGGNDEFEWSINDDVALQNYACGTKPKVDRGILDVDSFHIVDDEDDMFYDVENMLSEADTVMVSLSPGSSSVYDTPGSISPQHKRFEYVGMLEIPWRHPLNAAPPYHLTGLHMGATFLTSYIEHSRGVSAFMLNQRLSDLAKEQEAEQKVLDDMMVIIRQVPSNHDLLPMIDEAPPAYELGPLHATLRKTEPHQMARTVRRIIRFTLKYKGTVYWVLLYIFLRGPVEHTLKRALTRCFHMAPQNIVYTTVGVTATIAATLCTRLSSSLHV